jgi:uracil-DNA glycosylase family 4
MTEEQRRLAYLQAMGIQAWVPRYAAPYAPDPAAATIPAIANPATAAPEESPMPVPAEEPPVTMAAVPEPAPAPTVKQDAPSSPPLPSSEPIPACPHDWDDLAAKVAACTACPLHQTRTQTVFGVGHRQAEWMFIGEAPGEQEDLQGEPFVGRAGQLLNEMIRALGLTRDRAYIANVLKCRPPRNRDPAPEEAMACEGYLKAQLALVRPKIIVAVGRIAAQNLLKTATPIGKLRGQVHQYEHIPLVVTYHPAYLLRSQTEKRRAWEDLKLAKRAFQPGD